MDAHDRLQALTEQHLEELSAAVWDGRCVAFVGAGFSAAANLPERAQLVQRVAGCVPPYDEVRLAVDGLLSQPLPSSRALEAAAQLLQDRLGPELFRQAVADALEPQGPLPAQFLARKRNLLLTPFRAVLTTNFDPLLEGGPPGPAAYRQLLRHGWSGPWNPCYWPPPRSHESPRGPRILKLHGAATSDHLVFARRDYRELLFSNASYLTFLRALFATRTVLFMGFSFRDAYVDLLRSELIQIVDSDVGEAAHPLAYAILTDVTYAEALYLRRHEGMGVLWYPKTDDHAGFDALLERIADRTNPVRRLARRLAGARVLWMDPHPHNNAVAHQLFGRDAVEEVPDLEAAAHALRERSWDLVLSHWGWQPHGPSAAQRLLEWMQLNHVRVPVVVSSSGDHGDDNRIEALRWGAADLTWTWPTFFQAVDRVLPARP